VLNILVIYKKRNQKSFKINLKNKELNKSMLKVFFFKSQFIQLKNNKLKKSNPI